VGRSDGSSGWNTGLGDIVGTISFPRQANLSSPGNYYGPTPTCPPVATFSQAVDAGDDTLLSPPFNLSRDQTGRYRKYGYHVDIGAAEYVHGWSLQNPFVSNITSTNATLAINFDSYGVPWGVYTLYGPNTSYGSIAVSNQPAGLVGLRMVYLSM